MIKEVPKKNAPCLGCTDRKVGCHSSCKRYEAMKAENERIKENKAVECSYEMKCYSIDRSQKIKEKVRKSGAKTYG